MTSFSFSITQSYFLSCGSISTYICIYIYIYRLSIKNNCNDIYKSFSCPEKKKIKRNRNRDFQLCPLSSTLSSSPVLSITYIIPYPASHHGSNGHFILLLSFFFFVHSTFLLSLPFFFFSPAPSFLLPSPHVTFKTQQTRPVVQTSSLDFYLQGCRDIVRNCWYPLRFAISRESVRGSIARRVYPSWHRESTSGP